MASILNGILGNVIGSTVSSAVNAAQSVSQNKKPSSSASSGSSGASGSSGSSSSMPNNFLGSSIYVNTFNGSQQAIKDQMNANSQAWWNATTQEEKDRLHQENQYLASQLGGDVRYDGHTGMWTGWADGSGGEAYVPNQNGTYQPSDQSAYLQQMAEAYLKQQKEALKQAYEQNLSDLQAEQDKLSLNYQAARNQTAADSALSQKRWNETANAYGLNSGTQGQAALSYANGLQSDLSALHAAESAANAEIERQRTDLGKQYQSAMTQAIAENNYQLFQALYQEAVRVEQALQSQSQFDASLALQQYQTQLDKYYNDQSLQASQSQTNRAEQFDAAALLAQMGDYSAYGKLYGWDEATIEKMENAWKAANTPSVSTGGGSSSGGSSSGSSGSSGSSSSDSILTRRDQLFQAAYQSGMGAETYIRNMAQSYGFKDTVDGVSSLLKEYSDWLGGGMGPSTFENFKSTVQSYIDKGWEDQLSRHLEANWSRLSGPQQVEIQTLLSRYGVTFAP